ncbi:MAG: hypothetical protein AAF849_24695, partial [Bacteroidota bacterium]
VFVILLEKAEKEDFHLDFIASDFFKKHLSEFEDDLPSLKKIYLHCYLKQHFPFDRKGEYFKELYQRDNNFLFEFIKETLQDKFMFTRENLKFNFHFVWHYDNAEEVIDKVIAFTIEKKVYSGGDHIASKFFPSNDFNQEVDSFFNSYIEKHSADKERMKAIFSTIRICYPSQRVKYAQKLLLHNTDLELWYYIPIARSGFSGLVSSLIPFYEEQIEFWESLLQIFSGKVEYLKHRQWVQSEIKSLRNQIDSEIERDFIDDY